MLNNDELCQIKAGASKWTLGLTLGAILSFLAGVIDGYLRPLGCNE